MTSTRTGLGLLILLLSAGCVSTGKYQRKEAELAQLRADSTERDPVVANDSDQHRARNRRVEIELEPNITELPSLSTTAVAAGP